MPVITTIRPQAALPKGEVEVLGMGLAPGLTAEIGGTEAIVSLARTTRAILQVPAEAKAGSVIVSSGPEQSEPHKVHIGVLLTEDVHPVASPAADPAGNLYTTLSGSRGQQTPVSIFRLTRSGDDFQVRPYASDILNPSGLAFGPDGLLYVSSRAEGTVYTVGRTGLATTFAEGLGIATGIAFDAAGDLYVGDRSGTIFKIHTNAAGEHETFVFATLEPSIAAYHLAFDSQGVLYVTGPTTASNQVIHAIDPDGTTRIFFRGLGRAQGLAFDAQDNLYVAASLAGQRGIVRITPAGVATLAISGQDMVGLCFLPGGEAAITTRDAVFLVSLSA